MTSDIRLQVTNETDITIMNNLIQTKISSVQRKHALVAIVTGAAMSAGVMLSILWLTMLVDWWFELSWVARAVMAAVNLSAGIYLGVRFIVLPLIHSPDEEQVGLWVEEREPVFESRLITSIQLGREGALEAGASRSMVGAVVRQAEAMAGPLDFGRVVATDRMMQMIAGAVLVVLIGLVGLAMGGRDGSDLLKRALLVPGVDVPRKTRVIVSSAEETVVARGDDVTLGAKAVGVIPDEGFVSIKYESGREQRVEMLPVDAEKDDSLFARMIPNVQESFTYTVHLYDGRSAKRKVRAELRPAVAGVEIQQIFPEYTGLSPMNRSTGDLSILEGSRLAIKIKANKPVRSTGEGDLPRNYVQLVGGDLRLPLRSDPSDPTQLIAYQGNQQSIPVPKYPQPTTGFSVHLVDEYGLVSKDPAVYRIDLQPDRPPSVRITYPTRKEELATARASMVIGFDAADDFALGEARIRYTIRGPDEKGGEGDGWAGEYFDDKDFQGARVAAITPVIDFGDSQDKPVEKIASTDFSARWSGLLVPAESGMYTFMGEFDDAVRLTLDGKVLMEIWPGGAAGKSPASGPVMLEAGKAYPVKLEFQQASGPWHAKLRWKVAKGAERVVPQQVMFSTRERFEQTQFQAKPPIVLNIGGTPKSIRGRYEWDLTALDPRPPVGTLIEWWVEVEDTNNVSGPGMAASERFLTRIVTEDEKRAELMMRLGETWNPLDTIADEQRRLNEDLGQVIQGRVREPK